jgi:RNA polymerase sigma-70 factor (ECF subfamily)
MNSTVKNRSPSRVQRLFDSARRGDLSSLGLLLHDYFRYLNTLSIRHMDERVRVRVSPSDIVQETLMEAHRDFAQFDGTSLAEFTGWLRKILLNNIARAIETHLAAAKRDVRRQCSLNDRWGDSSSSNQWWARFSQKSQRSAAGVVQHEETIRKLNQSIEQLPPDYQQVIRWRHIDGLSFQEIASRLGRNTGAVRMLWFRAVEKLRGSMNRSSES